MKIIDIQKEVIIEQNDQKIILEKGDKIRVLEYNYFDSRPWTLTVERDAYGHFSSIENDDGTIKIEYDSDSDPQINVYSDGYWVDGIKVTSLSKMFKEYKSMGIDPKGDLIPQDIQALLGA